MGCGISNITIETKRKYPTSECWGVDNNFDNIAYMKSIAENNDLEINYRSGDILESGLDSHYFDIIVLNHVLEHIPEPDVIKLLREVKRMLKPQGLFFIGVPNSNDTFLNFARLFSLEQDHEVEGYTHVEIENLLAKLDFKVIDFAFKGILFGRINSNIIAIISLMMQKNKGEKKSRGKISANGKVPKWKGFIYKTMNLIARAFAINYVIDDLVFKNLNGTSLEVIARNN